MTEPLDELMELQPTHASALLIDPIDLAERAGRSARGARRRANVVLTGIAVAAVALVVGVGALFLRPTQAMPAARPTSAVVKGSLAAAPYSTQRVGAVEIFGESRPDQVCVGLYPEGGVCSKAVKLSGVEWSMVPWRETSGSLTTARVFLFGTFDGTTFSASRVIAPTALEADALHASTPPFSTSALITCEVMVNADSTEPSSYEPLSFAGFEAFWMDRDGKTIMVATSGDLGVAVTAVKKAVQGRVCIGSVPSSGHLVDLLAAVKRVNAAGIPEVVAAQVSASDAGVMQVSVTANVPGLSEKIIEIVGPDFPVMIFPVFLTVSS
jgi:hypothetical protein